MKKKLHIVTITLILLLILLFEKCTSSKSKKFNFIGAVAVWSLSDLNDETYPKSNLKTYGDVPIISLKGDEARASLERGGDAKVSQFGKGWLNAGQGTNEELNLTGKNVSILVRIKANEIIDGYVPIINKAGNDQSLAYAISIVKYNEDVYIESMIGSDDIAGSHLLKYKIPTEEYYIWHDILFRFNGKKSELFVDGQLRDDEITVGEIRDWNRKPFLIGAIYKKPFGYTEATSDQVEAKFNGLIDHVVLWNRYISDDEVKVVSGVKELKDGRPKYYDEKYRPQFHFSAKKNWINDPNGLFFYKGIYHLFFQYMPPHRPGAYKDWGHAISTDLVHWVQLETPITPHKVWGGCWSGSAVVDFNNSSGFQLGDEKPIIAFITNGGNPRAGLGPLCTQCIAYSTDGGNTFTYYDQNPVIKNIYNSNRDPKVVWDEKSEKWIMSIYMDKANDFGLFSSSNLIEWKYLSTVSLNGVAECPGFESFPVDGNAKNKKWLFFGANGNYMIGDFDGANFKPESKVIRGDYGRNFYAAQVWNNAPESRNILIAWMPTKRYPGMPFEQQMNFPTELTLRTTPDGIRVYRYPVKEISKLYEKESKWNNITIKNGDNLFKDLKGDLFDIIVEVEVSSTSSFEIGARGAIITYNPVKKILSCGGPSVENSIIPEKWKSDSNVKINFVNNLGEAPLEPETGKIKLRILVDRTSIEVFGNDGRIIITSCFMPEDNNSSYSFTTKSEVKVVNAEAHSLKSAWIR